jgi:hypothetical protein
MNKGPVAKYKFAAGPFFDLSLKKYRKSTRIVENFSQSGRAYTDPAVLVESQFRKSAIF